MNIWIKFRNSLHHGYGQCSRCGGNWGWKKHKTHNTSDSRGLFLFCRECDAIVTPAERWLALDNWKQKTIRVLHLYTNIPPVEKEVEIKKIMEMEFIEFPRSKVNAD